MVLPKRVVLSTLYFTLLTPLYAQEPPRWFFQKELCFPQEVYVSSLGVGATLQASRENAISELLLYFDSRISLDSVSELSIQETKDSLDKTKSHSSKINIASQGGLPSLSFTEPFFDEDSEEWYICAYINKDDFLKISLQEVQKGIRELEFTLKEIKKSSLFSQFINLSKILKDVASLQRRAKQISVLDFENGERMGYEIIKLKNASFSQREELISRKNAKLL